MLLSAFVQVPAELWRGIGISTTATAVLIAPVAVLVAGRLEVSPAPLLMAVALAASAAFLTPVASPVNKSAFMPALGRAFRPP